MSELKVNSISGIGGSVKINDPVGMGTNSRSGYALNTNGKINVEGSVEVVTIPSSNFGVRIRAPYPGEAGSTDSILQFTNNNGSTELAALHARSNGSLTIWSGGQPRIFVDDAGITFGPAANFSTQAKFNLIPPLCSVWPTQSDHLANKAYVDDQITKKTLKYYFVRQAGIPIGQWVDLRNYGVPRGAWMVKICVRLHTGDGPEVTSISTRVASGEPGAGNPLSSGRQISWIAALGNGDNAGAQMSGEAACAGYAGFDSFTELYVNYANYGAFIDGYWA